MIKYNIEIKYLLNGIEETRNIYESPELLGEKNDY